jgi:hypothetical protein
MSQYHYNKRDLAIYNTYQYVNGAWKLIGYKCSLCHRSLKTEKSVAKHLEVCAELNTTSKEKYMPIQRVIKNGEVFYRWGDQGKLYTDKKDAEKQAQAAYASGYKEPKKPE